MGVLRQSNIKVVKKNTLIVDEDVLLPFEANKNKIFPADTSIISKKFLCEAFILGDDEKLFLKQFISELRNNFAALQEFEYSLPEAVKQVNIIDLYFLDQDKLESKKYLNGEYKNLFQTLLITNFLKEKDGYLYETDLIKKFVQISDKLMNEIPFDWDYFSDSNFIVPKNLLSFFGENFPKNIIEEKHTKINNLDYTLLLVYLSNDSVGNSIVFLNSNLRTKKLRMSAKPNQDNHLSERDKDFLTNLDSRIKDKKIEVLPISSNRENTLLQGVINNKPVFARIDNNILKYCRNAFGKDLKITLNTEDINSNYKKQIPQSVLLNIFKDNTMVFSKSVNIQLENGASLRDLDKVACNNISYNITQLNKL